MELHQQFFGNMGAQVLIVLHDWVLKNLARTELCTVESLLGVSEQNSKWDIITIRRIEVDCKLVETDHNYNVKITQNSVDNFEQPPYLDSAVF